MEVRLLVKYLGMVLNQSSDIIKGFEMFFEALWFQIIEYIFVGLVWVIERLEIFLSNILELFVADSGTFYKGLLKK